LQKTTTEFEELNFFCHWSWKIRERPSLRAAVWSSCSR